MEESKPWGNRDQTERTKVDLKDRIGETFTSNLSPTLRGRLIKVTKKKCYFEVIENPEYEKYNICAGQEEDMSTSVMETVKFDK